jgi:hypothetical protein
VLRAFVEAESRQCNKTGELADMTCSPSLVTVVGSPPVAVAGGRAIRYHYLGMPS